MAGYALPIKRLIAELGKLPGIGEKTATRLAMHILRAPEGDARGLADSITEVRNTIRFCRVCYNFAEAELCNICRDAARDSSLICVVEDPDALMAIEESGSYSGTYHVLHGVLSPLDGIGPEQLHLRELVDAQAGNADMLDRLAVVLNIRAARRIECVDNSNIGGTEMVSGLVVYEDARPKKSDYRRYRIRTATGPDDYAAMSEVLGRRFGKDDAAYPDLLMVDGGKGQIGMAVAVARELGIEGRFQIIGIAKKDEARGETRDKIYQPGRSNPVNFRGQEDLLLFLQRIRDEAHRFAVSYHRKRRGKAALQSVLDHIPGIGIRRKKTLLQQFGSIKKIRAASVDELNALPGMNRKSAEAVHQALAS